jgi:hypothetical protein
MALLGKGMMVFWHDFEGDETDFLHWHSYEHMPERVGIAGFRRGKRFAAVEGEPKYLTYYETESVATLTSEGYLARLNDPTPWTKRNLAGFRNSNRTLCRVAASLGHGQGAAMLSIRLSPEQGEDTVLAAWLTDEVFPKLVAGPGIMGAHLLRGDEAASRTETDEKALRDTKDEVADWAIMVEGLTPGDVRKLRDGALSDASLSEHGGKDMIAAIYSLECSVAESDLP